jgi:hypothetical protein
MTEVVSNTATANILLPILKEMSITLCYNPVYLGESIHKRKKNIEILIGNLSGPPTPNVFWDERTDRWVWSILLGQVWKAMKSSIIWSPSFYCTFFKIPKKDSRKWGTLKVLDDEKWVEGPI